LCLRERLSARQQACEKFCSAAGGIIAGYYVDDGKRVVCYCFF
jgi:hypothetical protein